MYKVSAGIHSYVKVARYAHMYEQLENIVLIRPIPTELC